MGLVMGAVMPGGVWAQPAGGGSAETEVEALLTLQRELLGRAEVAEFKEEVDGLRPRLQSLVFDFKRYLRTNPKNPDGFIAYSLLLGNPLLDERERAKALLLKANSLDGNRAIVKNQLGKYLAEEGRPLEALNYFLSAVQLEPNEPLYHLQVGLLLGAARDDFLRSGEWTVAQIDEGMLHAFSEAVRLAPDSLPYAYRYAESFYDLQTPPWDEALEKWQALEARVNSEAEKQMMRLHQANVRLFQGELETAAELLTEDVDPVLVGQQTKLLARLERLRNPAPRVESEGQQEDSPVEVGERRMVKSDEDALVRPEFTAPHEAGVTVLNSATVVALAEESTVVEVTGTVEVDLSLEAETPLDPAKVEASDAKPVKAP
ncbi:MAG: hypothetical protein J6386_19900 [Candidatus Synoicihabitans palmerolidicus]|nr:hypothetical protein [Candidatus Synoicihabitans palmerolidicus]